ncbi:YslB family protein [Halalkalibacter sp. APA_J-10(15)]|uniref:YslB family protein n=1 Tax=unclassified Halalkalibacter TaxID=2893063 RepID=UPI001FF22371|nr:YslB family protein [Halalkalibacter sp. APA_J-10(15)]MCK0473586.1 YslB family protein [Halalkalibacter sp. APA_J-10(15)]
MNNINEFGYSLIRNDVLKDVLGREHDHILYWVGKSLARKYPLSSLEELPEFFLKANWGNLTLEKEKRNHYIYLLSGEWMGKEDQRCYQLESGFLAQQFESWKNRGIGVTSNVHRSTVTFDVQIDRL